MLGLLYHVETHTRNYHLKKVFADSELEEGAVIRSFRITAADGKSYDKNVWNISIIICLFWKNRIHWIRPILENANDPRIKYFQKINDDNENQHYFYYEDEAYLVILREVNPDLSIVTAFCVDPLEKYMYSSWYRAYKGI